MTTAAASQHSGPHPQLRRHKLLPRPQNERKLGDAPSFSTPIVFDLADDSLASSPHASQHGLRRVGPGPDPPPTPPDHSRNSSEGHSAVPLCPPVHGSLPNMFAARRPVATPPDQQSLPTPDVTPPGPVARSRALRSSALDRGLSRITGSESLTGSFKTAREVPSLSDDESGSFAVASQKATSLPIDPSQTIQSRNLLDLALNQIGRACGDPSVSCAEKPITTPDADVSSTTQVEHQEHYHLDSSPKRTSRRDRGTRTTTSSSATPLHAEPRRLPGYSSRASLSAVVGAVLIAQPPQRRRTLRHVQKRGTLREPDTASLVPAEETARMTDASASDLPERQADARLVDNALGATSVASGRLRRQGWKDGGIPVVVVPDRRSSSKTRPKEEHSRRSSSNRPLRKTTSLDSASSEESRGRQRSSARSRPEDAEAQSSDWRHAEDGPPTTAALCPSASASTIPNDKSQNATAWEACRRWSRDDTAAASLQSRHVVLTEMNRPSPTLIRFEKEESQELLDLGRHEDAASAKKYSSRNTPFSIASFETAPEVSEAMAVHMYPHQNSSLLVVDHLAKSPESTLQGTEADQTLDVPKIRTTCPNGEPVTPPRKSLSDEADSPLRNPRPPPTPPKQPPAINLIPATPSGCTPAHEKAAREGNYFEAVGDTPASHRASLVRRALGRRRKSMDSPSSGTLKPLGLLARSLSLSRHARHPQAPPTAMAINPDAVSVSMHEDAIPAEEDKLHPYWRPHPVHDEPYDDGRCRGDNWSGPPRRTLSARMKRTFAILPLGEDERQSSKVLERRTIRRSPSGSLRVMRRPASVDSLLRAEPWSAPGVGPLRRLWRTHHSLRSRPNQRGRAATRSEATTKLPRLLSERKRAKRSQELRQMISGPMDVRDGVREVIEPKLPRRQLSATEAREASALI
ncbi:hypothetical protein CP533_2483 [Ophiocordyceps camponoti-saundersi (nom. inval.)]|nr:hypothetical protein CP533_2483 [Ophiocordyceps camponoti-saundersi (nom. inval.)]